jgi:outer membrane protein
MKRIILLFFILIFALPVFAQKQLTLQEAISIALQRNPSLSKLKNNMNGRESQLRNAYGQLLPSLGASAGFNWSAISNKGGLQSFTTPAGQFSYLTRDTSYQSRTYNAGIGGSFTLFNGLSNIANISQASDYLKANEYSIVKQKQDIVYSTTDFYYIVLNNEELMKVRDENVKYYQKFFETVQERNKLGAVTLADVYTAQVQLGNAELQSIQQQNIYETSKAALLNYLALNVLDEYTLVDPFGQDKVIDTDSYLKDFDEVSAMVKSALDTRFDYKSQQLILSAAQSGVTSARGGIFPSLTGTYSYGSQSSVYSDLWNDKAFSVGFTLSVPIFSNFNIDNSIQLAKVVELNADEDLRSLERQIKIDIKQSYLDFNAAKKSLDVAVKNVVAAAETQKINQERYNLGSATILDILQANRDYTDALTSKINAVYEFYRQHDRLNNAIGRLDFSKYE